MKIIILHNRILSDGIGDFSHFVDIYLYLIRHLNRDIFQLIPVICCVTDNYQSDQENRFNRFHRKLQELKIPFYFYANSLAFTRVFMEDPLLIQYVAQASLILNISAVPDRELIQLVRHASPKTPLTYLGEHESPYNCLGWLYRSMGLSPNCYGLKIDSKIKVSPDTAFKKIIVENNVFAKILNQLTRNASITELKQNNLLALAYFQAGAMTDFNLFLLLLAVNSKIPANKNIILYLSSPQINELVSSCQSPSFSNTLNQTSIKAIEWIDESNSVMHTPINALGTRVVRVIYGAMLSSNAYEALYDCVDIAAVSGDNTFEKAISHQVLPFYRSYNYNRKAPTLDNLARIIKCKVPGLSKKSRNDFSTFFEVVFPFEEVLMDDKKLCKISDKYTTMFKQIDLPNMIEVWPIIAAYLAKHHNFYRSLDRVC